MEAQQKMILSEKHPEPVYANGVMIGISLYDTNIKFLRDAFVTDITTGVAMQEVVSEIRVSPQLAKVMAKNLADSVNNYEKQFGPIPDLK